MNKISKEDLENGKMGYDFYLMMKHDLIGDDPFDPCISSDGSFYIGDDIWLTIEGEFICEEK